MWELITQIIVSLLGLLTIVIPLVVKLVQETKKAVQEKNWRRVVDVINAAMPKAEENCKTGEDKKEYVLNAVKAVAQDLNYPIDVEIIGKLIDDLCEMSKKVNVTEVQK